MISATQEGPPWVWLRESYPIARKEHKCSRCGYPIIKGERCHVVVGLLDGDFLYYREHDGYCIFPEEYEE